MTAPWWAAFGPAEATWRCGGQQHRLRWEVGQAHRRGPPRGRGRAGARHARRRPAGLHPAAARLGRALRRPRRTHARPPLRNRHADRRFPRCRAPPHGVAGLDRLRAASRPGSRRGNPRHAAYLGLALVPHPAQLRGERPQPPPRHRRLRAGTRGRGGTGGKAPHDARRRIPIARARPAPTPSCGAWARTWTANSPGAPSYSSCSRSAPPSSSGFPPRSLPPGQNTIHGRHALR